jgi:hypothetical protein
MKSLSIVDRTQVDRQTDPIVRAAQLQDEGEEKQPAKQHRRPQPSQQQEATREHRQP